MVYDAALTQQGEKSAPEATVKPMTMEWRVQLLGGLSIARFSQVAPSDKSDAAPFGFRTHKAALLFARLLLYPHRAHGRDELADWLWPDLPADKGRANLSQTLHQLKAPFIGGGKRDKEDKGNREPNAPLFTGDHQTIRVRAGAFQTDVALFEKRVRAAQAPRVSAVEIAALWKDASDSYGGDLLPGFYDDWIEGERQRLRDLFETVCAKNREAEQVAKAAAPGTASQPQTVVATPQTIGFPLTLTRFFGRDAERADLCARLTHADTPTRLVTVVGAGGMGKTRLALQVAQQVGEAFVLAAFVSLADLSEAEFIPAALLQLLVPKTSEAPLNADGTLSRVVDFLQRVNNGDGRVLLVLDNLEQFGEACATVVTRLLSMVPRLTVLATSRQPVGVSGEQELWLGPLLLPTGAPNEALAPDVGLFVDRARLVRPHFTLTPQNGPAVRELCSLLESVPLALELAAAWVRTLSPVQITQRLSHRFDLLQRKGVACGDLPKRHQSLHATIAWSYDLLPPNLQTFWAQLSLFRGGWTADAARAVTGAGDVADVATPLLLLAERSLIFVDEDEGSDTVRYRMLESLREFAQEQWEAQEPDGKNEACLRLARYFADLSQKADTMTKAGRMRPALAAFVPERDNLRGIFAELQKVIQEKERPSSDNSTVLTVTFPIHFIQAMVEIIVQSVWLWSGKEAALHLHSAREAVQRLPDEAATRTLRARILAEQGRLSSLAGDYATATSLLDESLALWQALGNEREAVLVKNLRAAQAWRTGNFALAFATDKESLRFAQETGDLRLEASMLHNMAMVGPDLAQRREWIERAVSLNRSHWPGSTFHAASLNCMGVIASEQDDGETAQACLEEALEIAVADGGQGMVAVAKSCLAEFLHKTGASLDHAEDLLVEAQRLYEELEEPPRIATTLLTRFQIALKRGDMEAARSHARAYLHINKSAGLIASDTLSSAQEDLENQLQAMGEPEPFFAPHGNQTVKP